MADADRAYREARASGHGADEAAARLREATAAWEARFVIVADAESSDPQIVRDADRAMREFADQLKLVLDGERPPGDQSGGAPSPAPPEMTYEEIVAQTVFFSGLETLSEKEAREDAKAADEVRQRAQVNTRFKLDDLRKKKDHAFALLRDEYGVVTALDLEEYEEIRFLHDETGRPPFGWDKPAPPAGNGTEDAYPFGWERPKPPIGRILIGGAAAVGVVIIGGGVLLFAGGGGSSDNKSVDSGTPAAVVRSADDAAALAAGTAPADAPAGESTPGGPALSGNYRETITVDKDPAGHEKYVAMPSQMVVSVFIVRDKDTGKISLTLNGPAPWVNLTGNAQFGQGFDSSGGTFEATGEGVVAGRPGVGVDLTGSIVAGGGLQGSLVMGTNGVLPTGQPITYHIEGARQ